MTDDRPQGRVRVDVGLSEELLAKYGELQEAVLPARRALDDVHSGLDAMMALGGASCVLTTCTLFEFMDRRRCID